MAQNEVVLDGELSLNIPLDGEVGTVIEVGHDTGIDTIVFNADYTLTFNMTNGETFTTGSIRGEQGVQGAKGDKGDTGVQGLKGDTGEKGDKGDNYVLTQADKAEIAGMVTIPPATTTSNGLMSATDKAHLDDVYTDYSSALEALGVI